MLEGGVSATRERGKDACGLEICISAQPPLTCFNFRLTTPYAPNLQLLVNLTGTVNHRKKEKMGKSSFPGAKSICRGDLAQALLEKANEMANVNVHFGCTFSKTDMLRR